MLCNMLCIMIYLYHVNIKRTEESKTVDLTWPRPPSDCSSRDRGVRRPQRRTCWSQPPAAQAPQKILELPHEALASSRKVQTPKPQISFRRMTFHDTIAQSTKYIISSYTFWIILNLFDLCLRAVWFRRPAAHIQLRRLAQIREAAVHAALAREEAKDLRGGDPRAAARHEVAAAAQKAVRTDLILHGQGHARLLGLKHLGASKA